MASYTVYEEMFKDIFNKYGYAFSVEFEERLI